MDGAAYTSVNPADRPLAGLTVVVTRAREQSGALVRPLELLGAEVLAFPVIRVVDPLDSVPLERAVEGIAGYDWLVLTSTNGVDRFLDRLEAAGPVGEPSRSLADRLDGVKVAAVGSATAGRLRGRGIEPDLVPTDFRAEGLVEAFGELGVGVGCRILIPRAAEAREVLPEQMRAMGATVDAVDLYRLAPTDPDPAVLARLAEGSVDVITFASGATARHFVNLVSSAGLDPGAIFSAAKVASVGPVTSSGIERLGFTVDIEAATSTMESLVAEIAAHFGGVEPGSSR